MVYYFSATGNSKYVAEKIAASLGDACESLTGKLREHDRSPLFSEKPWVIVCPIFVATMPQVVADWVRATPMHGCRRIYFVFTAAADMGIAGQEAERFMKEKGLDYGGSTFVHMPVNYLVFFPIPDEEKCRAIIRRADPEIEAIADTIRRGETLKGKRYPGAAAAMIRPVQGLYDDKCIKGSAFYTNGKCIGCGKCSRVCPVNNITMLKNWPQWGDACIHCMSCVSGCPTEAIEYGKRTPGKRRYHFPKLDAQEETK